MPTGQIVRTWQDAGHAYMAVRVDEPGGAVEYLGAVAVEQLQGLSGAQKRGALVAACKAERDRHLATVQDLGLSGSVTL
jgi:hypothetical protein